MASYLSWGANAVLLAIGCFLVADTGNALFAAALTPPPELPATAAEEALPLERSWDDVQVILDRNLFNASVLAPPPTPAPDPDAELEATTLPLRLLGTAASPDPEVARAAIEDTEKRERLVVRVGDRIKNKATVLRIDRRRVVLAENDAKRELTLDEAPPVTTRRTAAARPSRRERASARRIQPAKPRTPTTQARGAKQLFDQARILPKFEDGEIVGMQISAIKPGGWVEEAGIEDGDIITELNGVAIDGPESTSQILEEWTSAESLRAVVMRGEAEEVIEFEPPDR